MKFVCHMYMQSIVSKKRNLGHSFRGVALFKYSILLSYEIFHCSMGSLLADCLTDLMNGALRGHYLVR